MTSADVSDSFVSMLAEKIAARMATHRSIELGFWNATEISEYLKRNTANVRRNILTLPSFPKAIRLPNDTGKSQPLYRSIEVIEWANSFKEKN